MVHAPLAEPQPPPLSTAIVDRQPVSQPVDRGFVSQEVLSIVAPHDDGRARIGFPMSVVASILANIVTIKSFLLRPFRCRDLAIMGAVVSPPLATCLLNQGWDQRLEHGSELVVWWKLARKLVTGTVSYSPCCLSSVKRSFGQPLTNHFLSSAWTFGYSDITVQSTFACSIQVLSRK
jgi:hypothetical protein